MSGKINVLSIVSGHIATLSDPGGARSFWDYFTFFAIPGCLSLLGALAGFKISSETSSLLVNFGAIFTALLLSVLVLVYDQESKLDEKHSADQTKHVLLGIKKELLRQLYFNISFSIVSSLMLILVCFVSSAISSVGSIPDAYKAAIQIWMLTPLATFITVNLLLTIVMVVKRMHTLLIAK